MDRREGWSRVAALRDASHAAAEGWRLPLCGSLDRGMRAQIVADLHRLNLPVNLQSNLHRT